MNNAAAVTRESTVVPVMKLLKKSPLDALRWFFDNTAIMAGT